LSRNDIQLDRYVLAEPSKWIRAYVTAAGCFSTTLAREENGHRSHSRSGGFAEACSKFGLGPSETVDRELCNVFFIHTGLGGKDSAWFYELAGHDYRGLAFTEKISETSVQTSACNIRNPCHHEPAELFVIRQHSLCH
jgi:hypothetical protein